MKWIIKAPHLILLAFEVSLFNNNNINKVLTQSYETTLVYHIAYSIYLCLEKKT